MKTPMRKNWCHGVAAAAAVLAMALPLHAQEVRFSGQVRPRLEIRDPAFAGLPAPGADDFVNMRTRLGVTASLPDNVSLLLQLQDVRFWGDDAVGSHLAVTELHQAFVEVARVFDRSVAVRAGRQEMQFGSERLIGPADWTPRGRAFDGVRAVIGTAATGTLNVFATRTSDRTAARASDGGFHGLYGSYPLLPGVAGDAYALYSRVRRASDGRTDQGTVGIRLARAPGQWVGEAEAAGQFGERSTRDVAAWMLRLNAGPVLYDGRARVVLSYEHYSGGSPGDEDVGVFDALFGTGHRFLGFADLFTNIPAHTGGRGVRELAVRTTLAPHADVEVQASGHAFSAASGDGLDSRRFGEEIDLRARYRWRAPLNVVGGVSHVWAGPALEQIGRLDRNMTWTYLMLNATF